MQIDIQARGLDLTPALRQYAERRLSFALSRAQDHIRNITVRLSDINGPRGGVDKQCQLQVRLDGMPSVVIQNTDENLYAAVDRAADRAGRAVLRQQARQHKFSRGAGHTINTLIDTDAASTEREPRY